MVTVYDTFTFGTWQADPLNGDIKGINSHSSFIFLIVALPLTIPPEMRACWSQSSSRAFHLELSTSSPSFRYPQSYIIRKPMCITETLLVLLSQQRITKTRHFKIFNILHYHNIFKNFYINYPIVKLASLYIILSKVSEPINDSNGNLLFFFSNYQSHISCHLGASAQSNEVTTHFKIKLLMLN